MQNKTKQGIINSYAKAWLDASFSLKKEEKVLKEIKLLSNSLEKDSLLWQKIISSNNKLDEQLDVINELSKKLKLSEITTNCLKLVTENKRLKSLASILDEWESLYYKNKSIVEVNVETVIPLSPSQDKKLKSVLEKKLNKEIKINYIINKTILGGLKINFDTFLIDDSLETKLKNIEYLILNK